MEKENYEKYFKNMTDKAILECDQIIQNTQREVEKKLSSIGVQKNTIDRCNFIIQCRVVTFLYVNSHEDLIDFGKLLFTEDKK